MTLPGHYGDGRSARRHAVTLDSHNGLLHVAGEHVDAHYPLAQVRLTEPFAHAAAIAYFDDGAHCEIDGAHYAELAAMLGQRPSLVVRGQYQWRVAIAAIALLVGVIGAGAVWGLPAVAGALTAMLPRSADLRIGELSRDALSRQGLLAASTLDAGQQADIRQIWQSVQPAQARLPMTLKLGTMPFAFGANALALPDGTVILNDAMARKILGNAARFGPAESAALAGVLAHEVGHIEGRHSMRSVVRASLTTAFAAYLFGDFSAVAAGAPAILLTARHSRAMETEADDYAMALLQARHLPLAPLADLFQRMEAGKRGERRNDGWLGNATIYLSSHPGSSERAARLRAAEQAAR